MDTSKSPGRTKNPPHSMRGSVRSLLFIGTAVGFFLDQQLAPAGLSITALLCLSIGLHNTWSLMVWLSLHREQTDNQKEHTDGLFANVDADAQRR